VSQGESRSLISSRAPKHNAKNARAVKLLCDAFLLAINKSKPKDNKRNPEIEMSR
jgi:hypothetical protein